ncbi:unnamed protein product [Parajaminaea phylloscopi]
MAPAPAPPPKPHPSAYGEAASSGYHHRAPIQSQGSYDATDPYHRHHLHSLQEQAQSHHQAGPPSANSHRFASSDSSSTRFSGHRSEATATTSLTTHSVGHDGQSREPWSGYKSSLPSAEPDAPPLPPQNSFWHRQAELTPPAASPGYQPHCPSPTHYSPREFDSPNTQMMPPEQWGSGLVSRPISSATGIIALYGGDDDRRRGSDSSSGEWDSARASRRISRPLPAIPDASPALLLPTLSEGVPSRSVSPYAPGAPSAAPSPLPYTASDPFSQSQDAPPPGSGDSSALGDVTSKTPSRNASQSNPAWSPMSSSFSSVQTSPAVGMSFPSLHRSQNSLGALSAMSADSWVSGDGYVPQHTPSTAPHDGSFRPRNDLHATQSRPWEESSHRRAESLSRIRTEQHEVAKRRAPLPTVPRLQHPQMGAASELRTRGGDGSDDDSDDHLPTPIQITPAGRPFASAHEAEGQTQGTGWPHSADAPLRSPNSQTLTPVQSHASSLHSSLYSHADRRDTLRPAPTQEPRISRTSFVDFSLLSHLAVLLKDALPRGDHVKGSISYPGSFTGKDIVSAIQSLIPAERTGFAAIDGGSSSVEDSQAQAKARRLALDVARSLKAQLFFSEVDWGDTQLQDGVDEVYVFLDPAMNQAAGDGSGGDQFESMMGQDAINFSSVALDLSLSFGKRASVAQKRIHPVSSGEVEELPTGVVVPYTSCYSPLCGQLKSGSAGTATPGCYSPSCPRSEGSLLQRAGSATGTTAVGDAQGLTGAAGGIAHKAWAELVPAEILASLPKSEITRQNAILEHIQKEEDFLADLELLGSLFITGLERPSDNGDPPPIPIGPERDEFIQEVFGNHRELVAHVKNFVERLHIRQREESPIIRSIGDLFLDAALQWQDAFVTYVSAYPIAKSRIGREQAVNPRFRDFLEKCRREPACRRLGLDNFIHRALPHLQRHPLLLQTIIDKTDETNPDRESCIQAKEVIVQQCKTADTSIQSAQVRAKIRSFAYNLQTKRNKAVVDMDLLNPERQLIHEGQVFRRPDFTELDWTELQAVLFDNYFMVTKLKQRSDADEDAAAFVLAKRPIPVEMLEVTGVNEASVSFSLGLNALHLRSDRESRSLWPLTIHHIGGKLEPLTLYVTSKQRRVEWRTKIEEAKGLRKCVVDANRAFDTVGICEAPFALPHAMSGLDPDRPPPGAESSLFHGRITCAVPFSMADQRKLMALGCADGVWIGLRNDPSSFRKVLHLKSVTQCAVLEEFGIFVVLADKVLISYSLEALVPTSTGGTATPRPPQKLSGNRGVLFFGIGVLKERTLLVYMKKKANESVFKALEPVVNQPSAPPGKSAGSLFTKLKNDMGGKGADWFRMYKVFFIPSEAYTMQFLRSKLAIVCARGFEIMNLDTLLPGTIPDFSRCPRDDARLLALARRVETAKPLGLFKLPGTDSDFLLCYDGFACYVDRSGEPIRLESVVEWEGTPHSVAFSAPYVLAFDARFVEVREALSGRLVQIVRGNDVRYVSGLGIVEGSSGADPSIVCVHRVRPRGANAGAAKGGQTQQTASSSSSSYDEQEVFELIPTRPQLLARQDTTATVSTGLLSYSGTTTSSLRSSGRGGGSVGGGGSSSVGGSVRRQPSTPSQPPTSPPALSQQQQHYFQQQGFATRTILPDPPAPAGWI